tara:strand:+ start:1510 stop:2619 length:1110 start_codon:yes stop_codon:yes gene_type:complete
MLNQLEEKIATEIYEKGPMRFKRFMHLALYDPEHGFYTNHVKIGQSIAENDFITHPEEYSPKYGGSFATLIEKLSSELPKTDLDIVEMGAGNGILARDLLDHLKNTFPDIYERVTYRIVEISPYLMRKQADSLVGHDNVVISKGVAQNPSLDPFDGFIITNELPDAFPVDIVANINGQGLSVVSIDVENESFVTVLEPTKDPDILEYLELGGYTDRLTLLHAHSGINEARKYGVPINKDMLKWYDSSLKLIKSGAIITTDYGYTSGKEHAKSLNNIRTYSREYHNHSYKGKTGLFFNVGKVDLTSDINFALLMQKGYENGFSDVFFGRESKITKAYSKLKPRLNFTTLIQGKNMPPLYLGPKIFKFFQK